MPWIDEGLFCDGCGAEIPGAPLLHEGSMFCCERCRDGLECDCALELIDPLSERPLPT